MQSRGFQIQFWPNDRWRCAKRFIAFYLHGPPLRFCGVASTHHYEIAMIFFLPNLRWFHSQFQHWVQIAVLNGAQIHMQLTHTQSTISSALGEISGIDKVWKSENK